MSMRGGSTVALSMAMLIVVSGSVVAQEAPVPSDDRPNVLIIVTDDQRGGMAFMPNTRRIFGGGGTRYTRGYTTTPVCCPARASIMTGQYAHNHLVKTNSNPGETGAESLDQSTTLARYLRDAGYTTGHFGKFLNTWGEADPPNFDHWVSKDKEAYYGGVYNVDGELVQFPQDAYNSYILRDATREFIEQSSSEGPWYAYVAPMAPHLPALPAPGDEKVRVSKWRGNPATREKDLSDKPSFIRRRRPIDHRDVRAKQLRTLLGVDRMVAGIFDTLEATGEADDTIAFFVADNGYLWGEHGLDQKGAPYLQAIHVPFFARWPGHFEAGAADNRHAANIDIAPTVLDAAGIEPAHVVDGRSLLESWRRGRILTEYWCNASNQSCHRWASLTSGRFQYTEYYDESGSQIIFREYYKLRRDPWQLRNLMRTRQRARRPNVAALHRQLDQQRDCKGTECL